MANDIQKPEPPRPPKPPAAKKAASGWGGARRVTDPEKGVSVKENICLYANEKKMALEKAGTTNLTKAIRFLIENYEPPTKTPHST